MDDTIVEETQLENNADKSQKGQIVSFARKGYTTTTGQEDIVDAFRDYYLQERKAGRTDLNQIFREYRKDTEVFKKVWFNPYPNHLKVMFRNFEKSLPIHVSKITITDKRVKEHQATQKIAVKKIEYGELEDGAKNLQQLLIEDANELLEESNAEYKMMDENGGYWNKKDYEVLRLKKKSLALGIAKEVLSGVNKHENIKIKRNKEGRETVGFVMDLMRQANAGELSEQDIDLLETGIPT